LALFAERRKGDSFVGGDAVKGLDGVVVKRRAMMGFCLLLVLLYSYARCNRGAIDSSVSRGSHTGCDGLIDSLHAVATLDEARIVAVS
jgi:hypothetical protein